MRIFICVVTGQGKQGLAKAKAKAKSQASVKAKAKSIPNSKKGVMKAKAVVKASTKVLKKPAQQGDGGADDQITYVEVPEHGMVKVTRKHRRGFQAALRMSEAIVIMISKCL